MSRAIIRLWAPETGRAGHSDLPCPWCQAQTAEEDRSCPGCGRSFG